MKKMMMLGAIVSSIVMCIAGPVDDFAQKKNVTASDNVANANRSVDGTRSETGWVVATKDAKPWIQVDLGEPREIGCVALAWGKDFASDYTIALSNDGEKYKTIATKKDENGFIDAVGFAKETARFVKLAIEKSASNKVNLRSFEIYEGRDKQDKVVNVATKVSGDKVAIKGRILREWTFDENTDWREAQFRDVHPEDFQNNYSWGKKDIEVRPCQGYRGAGLMINIRGISQGQMQFWTGPWPLVRHKFYKITFKAKVENFNGALGVLVRRAKNAWTRLVEGPFELPVTEEWQEFSFSGPGKTDIDNDFGVMFNTSGMGRIMLDDIRVEEYDQDPSEAVVFKNNNPIVKGNILPNSSMEILRNRFWTAQIPQNDPYLHFSDPGFVRREGGKFGKYCFALESVDTRAAGGGMSAESLEIPVASGVPYTFSLWYNGKGRAWSHCTVSTRNVNGQEAKASAMMYEPKGGWSNEWRRLIITTPKIPELCDTVRIAFSKGGEGELYVDGMQLEVGDKATDYEPMHPYEIEATVKGGLPNIVAWGEKIPLEITGYSAFEGTDKKAIPCILKIVAFPDKTVFEKKIVVKAGETFSMDVDPVENGIFRIELTPEDSSLAPAFQNIAARLPKPREDVDVDSFFGSHISVRPYLLNYAHRIGIKWERLHDCSNITKMRWGNPKEGEYNYHDESIDAIRKAKLNILGMPDYFPQFARREAKNKDLAKTAFKKDHNDRSENPIDVAIFTNWCTRVAEHYKGRIDHWEVVNEPYMNYFYPGNAWQYAEIFEAGAKALRVGNPNTKIVGWCMELKTDGFVEHLPKENISDIDAYSFHSYFDTAPGGGTMSLTEDLNAVKKNVLTIRDPGAYWNTEGSWPGFGSLFYNTNKRDSTVKKHMEAAAADSRIWIEQKKAGITKFFFYTMHQTDGMRYRAGYKNLIDYDRTVTTGAAATSVTAWFIDGLDPKPLTQREGVVEGLFSGKGRTTYCIYDDALYMGALSFDISKLPSNYLVCDVMGTDLRKLKDKTFKLNTTPIFVSVESKDWEKVLFACQSAIKE